MEKEIIKKLENHDKRFDKIDKKLEEHDKKFDKIDKKLENHDKQFARNEKVHSKIVKKLLEHDGEFVKVREEAKENRDMILTKLGQVLGVVSKLDTERYAMISKTDRMQEDIKKVKKVLKLA